MKRFAVTNIPELVRLGRTAGDETSLSVFWTASGVELTLQATDLFVELEACYGGLELWLDVLIDGELSQRIQLPAGVSRIPVFQHMEHDRTRCVRILRDTQAMGQDTVSILKIRALETDDAAVFLPAPAPVCRLEFIGDSITSGEGAGLERQTEWVPAVFSAVNSYGYLTAERLGARANILSSSGWGLYSSWDGDTACALPPYYNEVCGLERGEENEAAGSQEPWDFASYRPEVIVINLGTNDSGALQNTGKWTKDEYHLIFIDTAMQFLKTLRQKNPDSYLLWAYGMLGRDMTDWIREAIGAYKASTGDERVSLFLFEDCDEAHLGVRYHPNRRAHEEAADALAAEIKKILDR